MDIAIPPAHRPLGRTQARLERFGDGFPERQPARGIPDQGRKHVRFSQGQTDRHAQGFLPAAKKNPAMNFSGAVKRS